MRGIFGAALLIAMTATAASGGEEAVRAAIAAQIDAGYCQSALARLQPLLKTDPGSAVLQLLQGRALIGLGRLDEARELLESAVAAHPGDAALHRVLGEADGAAAEKAGPIQAYRLARATREQLQQAVELAPTDAEARMDLAQFYLQAPAVVGGGREAYRQQMKVLEQLSPLKALQVRAIEAQQEGRGEAAEALLRQAVGLDSSPDSRHQLGQWYLGAGRPREALAVYRASVAQSPEAAEPRYWLGVAAVQAQAEITAGIAALQAYLALPARPDAAPAAAWASLRLCALLGLDHQPEPARRACETARQQAPAGDAAFAAELRRLGTRP